MFSENGKISVRQISRLLLFDVFGITSLLLPSVAVRETGSDAMAAALIGGILAICYIVFFIYFGWKSDRDYITYMEDGIGSFFCKLFLILYMIKILFSLVFLLCYFADLLEHTLLTGTNYLFIIGAILLVGIYAGSKGPEERGRTAEFLTYIIFVPVVFFLIIGLKKVDYANVLPVFTENGSTIMSGSYSVLLTYSSAELLLFLTPLCKRKKTDHNNRSLLLSAVFLVVLISVFCLLSVGILGQKEIADRLWSSITVMQIVELPGGLVRRQDALFLSLWILTVLLLVSSLVCYLCKFSAKIVGVKKEKYFLLPAFIIAFALSGAGYRLEAMFSLYGDYMKYIGFPQSVLMPPIIYCAHILRKERRKM